MNETASIRNHIFETVGHWVSFKDRRHEMVLSLTKHNFFMNGTQRGFGDVSLIEFFGFEW
jgi:hypothetical protein